MAKAWVMQITVFWAPTSREILKFSETGNISQMRCVTDQ